VDAAVDYYSRHRPELVLWALPARPKVKETEAAIIEPKTKPQLFATRIVPVMFATDRREAEQRNSICTKFLNGRNQGGQITYGIAEVSIPRGHRRGKLERPAFWKLQFREDSRKHVVILSCDKKDRASWRNIARARLKETESKAALIFIHGFGTSFDEAIRHAAQIGYDLQFAGLVTAFSWCSEAKRQIRSYAADISNARLSVERLIKFLHFLRTNVGATEISIIAHSMGNLVLIEALRKMKIREQKMREVVFAAPDYDADEFRQAAVDIREKARRYTLYGSEQDVALRASKRMRKGNVRAGDGGNNVLVVGGVETIGASAVGGDLLGLKHSYFSSKKTLLSDLYYVIKHSLPPWQRDSLISAQRDGFEYWLFQP
jgi:esterase/lipase superfamily enzyme